MSLSDQVFTPAMVEDIRNSRLTQYFGVASFSLLLWDHIVTFSDEVELIWKGAKGPLVYLFLLNRYVIPLSFIVNIFAYFSHWNPELCSHRVRFEGSMTMTGLCVVALMMFLRVRALYRRVWAVQAVVISILLAFIGVNSWLLTRGIPVSHVAYPYVDSCTMIIDPRVGPIASASAFLPLLYDTVVVGLTLYRTVRAMYTQSAGQILRVMLHEGLLYYSVICIVTLTLTAMIVSANPSVKNITAQLELCITVAMMSRITLHLKRFAHSTTTIDSEDTRWNVSGPHRRRGPRHAFEVSTLRAPPPAALPPGFSVYSEGESFPLQSLPGPAVSVTSRPEMSVEDPHMRDTLSTVGDEELAGSRGYA